jgi:hypothetical protein
MMQKETCIEKEACAIKPSILIEQQAEQKLKSKLCAPWLKEESIEVWRFCRRAKARREQFRQLIRTQHSPRGEHLYARRSAQCDQRSLRQQDARGDSQQPVQKSTPSPRTALGRPVWLDQVFHQELCADESTFD